MISQFKNDSIREKQVTVEIDNLISEQNIKNSTLTWFNINVYSPPLKNCFSYIKSSERKQPKHILKNGKK